MYRIITGVCHKGSQAFVKCLSYRRKDRYTIRECVELTYSQYGTDQFVEFIRL